MRSHHFIALHLSFHWAIDVPNQYWNLFLRTWIVASKLNLMVLDDDGDHADDMIWSLRITFSVPVHILDTMVNTVRYCHCDCTRRSFTTVHWSPSCLRFFLPYLFRIVTRRKNYVQKQKRIQRRWIAEWLSEISSPGLAWKVMYATKVGKRITGMTRSLSAAHTDWLT